MIIIVNLIHIFSYLIVILILILIIALNASAACRKWDGARALFAAALYLDYYTLL